MEKVKIPQLELNHKGYWEFSYNNVTYYILEGVLTLKGKAHGFSSEYDAKMYFIDRDMPNQRLKEGVDHAMKHYLNADFSFKKSFMDQIADEIFGAFHRVANNVK